MASFGFADFARAPPSPTFYFVLVRLSRPLARHDARRYIAEARSQSEIQETDWASSIHGIRGGLLDGEHLSREKKASASVALAAGTLNPI